MDAGDRASHEADAEEPEAESNTTFTETINPATIRPSYEHNR